MKWYRTIKPEGHLNVEQRELLDKVTALSFAVLEASLYLDGHPNNRMALTYYTKMKADLDEATKQYETKFGPLSNHSVGGNETDGWLWTKQPWPWETNFPETSDRPMLNPEETKSEGEK